MPTIYLSPSTQEFNRYVNGTPEETEEYYMNLGADAMIPYLRSNGILYKRNTPEMTAGSSLRESNAGNYDLHIALHSNAAPESLSGKLKGTDVYYAPNSSRGKRFADIVVNNLKNIYPVPDLVKAVTTTRLGEVTKTKAPAVLIEFAYHDNPEDAQWIKDNIDNMAREVVRSITQYFGLPFVSPQPAQNGTVRVSSGSLNIRAKPSTDAPIVAHAYNGDDITVLGQWKDWYVVSYGGVTGYAKSQYIEV